VLAGQMATNAVAICLPDRKGQKYWCSGERQRCLMRIGYMHYETAGISVILNLCKNSEFCITGFEIWR
jgi:hypothetical protein